MSSRTKILAAIKSNLPEPTPLPDITGFASDSLGANSVERFIEQALSVSSSVRYIKEMLISDYLTENFEVNLGLYSVSKYWKDSKYDSDSPSDPHELRDVEVGVVDARFGVIENGAVWVDEDSIGHRALPFICQHLVVILKREDLLENMHDAYELINKDIMPSFGLFIGGPSKTADIEQALVLGAHGPLTNTILILD